MSSVVNFDVANFHQSTFINLFTDAISYTKTMTNVDVDDQLSIIIIQSRKI